MATAHHVLLVPGFFGFANLGDFAYFGHVRDLLVEALPPLGVEGEVLVVRTVPTASLPKRAAILAEAVAKLLDKGDAAVSLVGHSSGGLDARLLASPGAALPTEADVGRCAAAVRNVITVSTPHFGTPAAQLFNSLFGQQLLRLISLATMYVLRAGRLPLGAVLRLTALLRGRDQPGGVVEQLYAQLLADFSRRRRRDVERFFTAVGSDQDLLPQITPAGMDLLNAATPDRPGVRYGCVVTRAREPGLRSLVTAGVNPYAQATHALYVGLHRVNSGMPAARVAQPTPAQAEALHLAFVRRPDARSNDGMVPTLSQVWGDVVAAAWADHLDIIGHFHQPTHVPPHFDWLASGSGFDRPRFERVWASVASYLAGRPAGQPPPGAARRRPAR